ncbi:acyl-CoA dehydrogenase family protein [Rhodococcus koreensis]|uniref:Acyl-CoA dehydrogenase n=1 Tax=Rhodococcus koreensis TaxID=99653 RepID=A0A1H4KXG6_9NOCA|nr:acyl-CoA dehydrogenase family protein [Rhodococcus koreensis]SEB63210.1 hypothetical protein SAMN04490239_0969 [Rhodococcus koreensis]
MDFTPSPRTEEVRAQVRAIIREHFTDEERRKVAESGTLHSQAFHRGLAAAGILGAAWPVDEGGQDFSPHEMDVVTEEAARAGAPLAAYSTTMLVAETIRRMGSRELRDRVLPGVLAGETIIALGYTEPGVGSDVAAVRTRATRREDGKWVINGEKAFTTSAEVATYVFVLARTNPDVPRHRGLSLFLVPTSTPGISFSPVHTLGGEKSNMSVFDNVVVGDDALVGEVDGGWQTMIVALDFERGGEFAAEVQRLLDLVVDWAGENPEEITPHMLRRLGRAATATEVSRLLGIRTTGLRAEGRPANLEGTMAKLYGTETLLKHSSQLLDSLGARGAARARDLDREIEHVYRHSFVTTIYGGTSEVLRGVLAERRLGLPRAGSKS